LNWLEQRSVAKRRHAARYDATEAEQYASIPGLGYLTDEQLNAHWDDISQIVAFEPGMQVLDVGAGPGALTSVLAKIPKVSITALEPSPAMLACWRRNPEFEGFHSVEGFCDDADDRSHFERSSFDLIACRQVVNGLFDPLTAFRHWGYWLKPGGRLLVLEAMFARDGWTGIWQEEVDVLPCSCCQSMGTVPYLLESVGYSIQSVAKMDRVNSLPSTRTERYMVLATAGSDPTASHER
jgi:SAM-dependent methyltransferase